jgi:hypothetical protein
MIENPIQDGQSLHSGWNFELPIYEVEVLMNDLWCSYNETGSVCIM